MNIVNPRIKYTKQKGFTIVELIVVAVVIAILAALTVVSYTALSHRAYDTKLKTNLTNAAKAIKSLYSKEGSIPPLHYDANKFFADPSSTKTYQGLPIRRGGGIGNDLVAKGYLPPSFKGSTEDYPWDDVYKSRFTGVQLKRCMKFDYDTGKYEEDEIILFARSYSGASVSEMYGILDRSDCSPATEEKYFLYLNGLSLPKSFYWSSSRPGGALKFQYERVKLKS